ncbi:TPA: helix-turn-helix transcriptional regulator [Streptococcus suis]|uniref:helix-turn-helix domain-containing protein n=1 Tax=Streptococcus TaxID=1301 RepID=UPI00195F45AE|nr:MULTISPECIES: helix-turn-helix transcriptional regulator [Streptococcus]MBM7135232.1 helix-turn-helix transcriptional regulator [Streptococcus suis]MBY0730030.1 helix-turn-helix domain-containing protein [Streptococcus sp. 2018162]MCB2860695.1 helix-turn-helix transcriptional regulator [Streptococcus suis]MCB2869232.1 helix-turn-helix transcriptional regulator [Streptococcus suis]MCO8176353.1 helix-turn-helix domain-containing protein [Streptococcus suis]
MRWDYGSVYKSIRKSKRLSQEQVCGDFINRTTLVRFEKNQTIPSYELMRFLLKQVDMTFEEFEYLCNYYQPSQRQQLLYDIDNLRNPTTKMMEDLIKRCHDHLNKEPDDGPIRRKCQLLETVVAIRKSTSFNQISEEAETLSKLLWSELERYDNWYHNDIILVGTLLSKISSLDSLEETANLLLKRLEKYKDYKRIQPTILSFYQQLSLFTLEQKQYSKSTFFATKLMELAKQEKRYDQLARAYVYLGIAQNKQELIDKGLQILELTDEQALLDNLQFLIKQHQTD